MMKNLMRSMIFMNDEHKGKIRGAVKAYLYQHQGRLVNNKELLEYINTHNFGLQNGVSRMEFSRIMETMRGHGIGRDVVYMKDENGWNYGVRV